MKKQLFSRILIWILVVGMVLPLLVGLVSVYSVSQSDLDALRQKKNDLAAQRAATAKELASIQKEMSSILRRKEVLDQKMALNAEEIDLTDELIAKLDEEITAQYAEIDRLAGEEAVLYEKFKKRLRVLYEEGNASYWEVLLGAGSFSELLDRIDKVGFVLEHDNTMMASLQNIRRQTEETTLALEANKAETVTLRQSLAENQTALEADAAEAAALIVSLSSEEAKTQGVIDKVASLEKQAAADFAATAKALEKKRKEEEERKRKEEEERRKKEEQNNATNPGKPTTPVNPNPSGLFTWPLPGHTTITSYFGWRKHPITGQQNYHSGVDIYAPAGTPILVAASGTVIENTYNSTFGYYVRVDHGNGYITLYGHMRSKSKVAVGSTVGKGEVIGGVGSTGLSTGNHLHFTMYKNGTLVDPLSYVKKY